MGLYPVHNYMYVGRVDALAHYVNIEVNCVGS